MSSIRDRAAASRGSNTERVQVPEWDDIELEFRPVTVKKRAELLKNAAAGGDVDLVLFGPSLIVASVYDPETGDAAFTDSDVEMLTELPAGVIDRLASVAMRISGMTPEAVDAGKDGS